MKERINNQLPVKGQNQNLTVLTCPRTKNHMIVIIIYIVSLLCPFFKININDKIDAKFAFKQMTESTEGDRFTNFYS